MDGSQSGSENWTAIKRKQLTTESAQFRVTRLLWLAAISILIVPIATLMDVPIARWFAQDPLSRETKDILEHMEVYAHGFGVFLVLVCIIQFAPNVRWHVPRLATLALGAGAVATLTKLFIIRPRPHSRFINLDSPLQDSAWAWSFDWSLSQVADFEASRRAFPSANVAAATALTVGLIVVLPRGRWLFTALCIGTVIQRLNSGGHFLSDLVGSISIGLGWAYVCYHPALLGSLFDKMKPEPEERRRRQENRERVVAEQEEVKKRAA